jgi:hypothetical protein
MFREMGYYWVKDNNVSNPEWRVAKWDGFRFFFIGTGWTISGHHLDIDECRIVRDETRRGARKSEKAKRNLYITTVVLRGDRMTDVAKLHGITPTCVRYIVHRTLKRRNPALFKKLTLDRPRQATPSIGDLATHAAEFGFGLQGEVGDGQK